MFVFLAYFSSVVVLNGFAPAQFLRRISRTPVVSHLRALFATISLLRARDLKSVVWMFIAASCVSAVWQMLNWMTGADILASRLRLAVYL